MNRRENPLFWIAESEWNVITAQSPVTSTVFPVFSPQYLPNMKLFSFEIITWSYLKKRIYYRTFTGKYTIIENIRCKLLNLSCALKENSRIKVHYRYISLHFPV